MVKYILKLTKYSLPDAIQKQVKENELKEKNKAKEEEQNKLKNIEDQLLNDPNNKYLLEEKERIVNNINQINNSIVNIKSELYNSTANFYNSNINNLTAQINDISSLIKDNSKFSTDITKKVSDILANQIKPDDIFNPANFEDLLTDFINKANLSNKEDAKIILDSIKELKELKESDNSQEVIENKIKDMWNDLKDELKNIVSEDKIKEIISDYSDKIDDISKIRDNLINSIFKDEKEISSGQVSEYIYKIGLLSEIYDISKSLFENKYLTNLNSKTNMKHIVGLAADDFKFLINNLRKWFLDDSSDLFKDEYKIDYNNPSLLLSEMNPRNLFKYSFIKEINSEDIKKSLKLINNIKDFITTNILNKYIVSKNEIDKNDTSLNEIDKNKESSQEKVNAGLNSTSYSNEEKNLFEQSEKQIKLLKQIIRNQHQIIRSLMFNNMKNSYKGIDLIDNYEEFSGKFNVEKYNPNMSITEFKKLFMKNK